MIPEFRLPFKLDEDDLHQEGEAHEHINPQWLVKQSRVVLIRALREERSLRDACNSILGTFEQVGGSWAVTIVPSQFKDGSMANCKAIAKFNFYRDEVEYFVRITKTAGDEGLNWN